jgi:hypothetical protein
MNDLSRMRHVPGIVPVQITEGMAADGSRWACACIRLMGLDDPMDFLPYRYTLELEAGEKSTDPDVVRKLRQGLSEFVSASILNDGIIDHRSDRLRGSKG